MDKRILIAEIGPAHGIRGEAVARVYTDDPQNLISYGELTDEAGANTYRVVSVRPAAKGAILKLKGVVDRTEIERLRGLKLYVERSRLPSADADSFYHVDLIGLDAVTEDGKAFGRVIAVQNFGSGDLLEISVHGQRESELIQFIDRYVPKVDVAGGLVVIVPPVMVGEPEPKSDDNSGGHDDEE